MSKLDSQYIDMCYIVMHNHAGRSELRMLSNRDHGGRSELKCRQKETIPRRLSELISGTSSPGTGPAPRAKLSTYATVPAKAIVPATTQKTALCSCSELPDIALPGVHKRVTDSWQLSCCTCIRFVPSMLPNATVMLDTVMLPMSLSLFHMPSHLQLH